jgi:FMN phosphatase YigB (HAD superfamily)
MLCSVKTAVLIDFDGVVLKKHPAHNTIVNKCNQYINKYVNFRNPMKVAELNTSLYKTYGHTVLGLHKIGHHVDLNEFNTYVYESFDYFSHFKDLSRSHYQDVKAFNDFIDMCYNDEVTPFIFSNAPDIWCRTIMSYMDNNLCTIPTMSDITQVHLKPVKKCYERVEEKLKDFDQIMFLDDSIINFKPIITNNKWTKILISPTHQDAILKITNEMYMTSNFPDLKQYAFAKSNQKSLTTNLS